MVLMRRLKFAISTKLLVNRSAFKVDMAVDDAERVMQAPLEVDMQCSEAERDRSSRMQTPHRVVYSPFPTD